MALGGKVLDLMFDLYGKGFFKEINSVIDMGDQDVNATFNEIQNKFENYKVKFNERDWANAKNFPKRPRVSTSILWKSFGVNEASRMDIIKLDRDSNDDNKHFIQDLNFPLKDTSLEQKFDLVTDIGNNEHPFNIVEAYNTMHKLCKINGYMIIYQAYLNGNGFYQFDSCTVDNIAAANEYSILNSSFIINQNNLSISIPLDKNYLKLIDLNNVNDIGIFYLLKKNSNKTFQFPYQGGGKTNSPKEYYTLSNFNKSRLPEQIYLPHTLENISFKDILKSLIKRIIRKVIKK